MKDLQKARGKIQFPANPSLFPVSITIQETNKKNLAFKMKQDEMRNRLPARRKLKLSSQAASIKDSLAV